MKATVQERKDGFVTLQLEDGQSVRLPDTSVHADPNEQEVILVAVSKACAKDDGALARAMINEFLT